MMFPAGWVNPTRWLPFLGAIFLWPGAVGRDPSAAEQSPKSAESELEKEGEALIKEFEALKPRIERLFQQGPTASKEELASVNDWFKRAGRLAPKGRDRAPWFFVMARWLEVLKRCRAARQIEDLYVNPPHEIERVMYAPALGYGGDGKTRELIRNRLLPEANELHMKAMLAVSLAQLGDVEGGNILIRGAEEEVATKRVYWNNTVVLSGMLMPFAPDLAAELNVVSGAAKGLKRPTPLPARTAETLKRCAVWWEDFGTYLRPTADGESYTKLHLEAKLCELLVEDWLALAADERRKKLVAALPRDLSIEEWAALHVWERTGLWLNKPWSKPGDLPARLSKLKESGELDAKVAACVERPAFGEKEDLTWRERLKKVEEELQLPSEDRKRVADGQ